MSSLTLGEVKRHLNIPTDAMGDNSELQATLDAAEAMVSARVGPLEPTTVTERIRTTSNGAAVLNVTPVLSLTSVTQGASSFDVALFDLDPAGVVRWATAPWRLGTAYVVTYVAGRVDLPDDLRLAVLRLTEHLWASQRGGMSSNRPGSPSSDAPAPGYAMPYAVAELLAPYTLQAI